MTTVFITSIAGLFTWSTIVRLWLGRAAADSGRGSVASIKGTGFGWFGQAYGYFGLSGVVGVALFLVILIGLANTRGARNWGPELRAWLWAYPAFLMVGTMFHTGQLRYFLADFPLALILVGSPPVNTVPKIRLAVVTSACLLGVALQWLWIDHAFILHSEILNGWFP